MFEKFSPDAIRATVLATDEAGRLRHDYIGTEHIFLSVIASEGAAAQLLKPFGLDIERARLDVKEEIFRNPTLKEQSWLSQIFSSSRETPFTESSKKLLEAALEEARTQGLSNISDTHLMLALIRLDGPAKNILLKHKVDLVDFRQSLVEAESKR